jgi:transcriptional regulator with XRE-family HTH domain
MTWEGPARGAVTVPGNSLRELRRRAGLKLQNVADFCGVSVATSWRWENGTTAPRADKAARLAVLYKLPVESIVAMFDEPRGQAG